MSKRRKNAKKIYRYNCSILGEEKTYKLTAEAKNPDDLVSVNAYYQLNPEMDDRPEVVKIKMGVNQDADA